MSGVEKKNGLQLPEIAATLWKMIADGRLKVGDKLPPERKLAETLNVSRGMVRQGILSLAERGILARRHGDGTYISSVSEDQFAKETMTMAMQVKSNLLAEVLEFRGILEPQTAALAASRISKEELNALKVIVCNQQLRTGAGGSDLDAEFHLQLAKYSKNHVLFHVMELINDVLSESRAGKYQSNQRHDVSVAGHLKIIDALEQKNPDDAFRAMAEHLEQVSSLMIDDGEDNKEKARK
jgi:GntR family transcriptional regulator, transcriptional repressor for pyruvate dehydrogenase complex